VKLYPGEKRYQAVEKYKKNPYICIAPTSVWFTKQYPAAKWVDFLNLVDENFTVYLIGGPVDHESCQEIINSTINKKVNNLCGKLNFLESAALMEGAHMNYVNDSAPLHMASAVDARVTAIFCSTVPYFGFGPLSSSSSIIETQEELSCRPCGLHGYKKCPEEHFYCAKTIKTEQLLKQLRIKEFNQ
jgi:heptosyltransferase-2